jgi:hypothetical protein
MLLLILSIFIIFVVFYRTITQGCSIKREGLEGSSQGSSQDSSQGSDSGDSKEIEEAVQREIICSKNKYDDATKLPLREYLIKGCFNTAYYVDVSSGNIEQRLAEGYRFLDFDLYCASGGTVYVGFSKDNAPQMGSTVLTFEKALECIANNAFTKPKTSKYFPKKKKGFSLFGTGKDNTDKTGPTLYDNYIHYPVWVHIRVYRPADSNTDIIA